MAFKAYKIISTIRFFLFLASYFEQNQLTMKHILKKTVLLAALVIGMAFPLTAQRTYVHLVITLNDGTEETYDMLNSSYMYFEAGEKLIITESIEISLSYRNGICHAENFSRTVRICFGMICSLEKLALADFKVYPVDGSFILVLLREFFRFYRVHSFPLPSFSADISPRFISAIPFSSSPITSTESPGLSPKTRLHSAGRVI